MTAAAAVVPCLPAPGQDAPLRALDPAVLERLSAEDHGVREAATRTLLRDERMASEALEAALATARSYEVAHRLRAVWRHRVIESMWQGLPDGDAGAMGLRHLPAPAHCVPGQQTPGVRVAMTLPGFPAHAYLEAGDVIVAIHGVAFGEGARAAEAAAQAFTQAIEAHGARRPLAVTVLRGGRRLELTMPTAPHVALNALLAGGPPLTLRGAQREALSRAENHAASLGPQPTRLRVPLEPEALVSN